MVIDSRQIIHMFRFKAILIISVLDELLGNIRSENILNI